MNKEVTKTVIKRESKNSIRAEFDRTPLFERIRAKYFTLYFLQRAAWYIFRLLLLIGISYIILYPFISKISNSFKSPADFTDVTVSLIPRNPTLNTYKEIITENGYLKALLNTFILAGSCAVLQTFVCCLIGYGFAKFKFKGNKILFVLVIFTMVVPHATLKLAMQLFFRNFDILGVFNFLGGGVIQGINILDETYIRLNNTYWPLWILSATGLAFKNGLYIYMFRQYFKGVPDELEESAYVDGSGVFRTFLTIILPMTIPMMVTVFMFSFSWQWTDEFYITTFFSSSGPTLMKDIIAIPKTIDLTVTSSTLYSNAILNTCGLLIIAPLLVIYLFAQKFIIQGIERSGITG
ncbi:MAG: carbohydrate ABC transporter permease [Clostridia bacterium]|nr:carbohydrate ABC transporter permease [Clostridia bacterium]